MSEACPCALWVQCADTEGIGCRGLGSGPFGASGGGLTCLEFVVRTRIAFELRSACVNQESGGEQSEDKGDQASIWGQVKRNW